MDIFHALKFPKQKSPICVTGSSSSRGETPPGADLVRSFERTTPSCAAGRLTIATARERVESIRPLTGTSPVLSGVGYGRSTARPECATSCDISDAAVVALNDASGVLAPSSSMCSLGHPYTGSALAGWERLPLQCLLESRMRTERRMSGSARGDERPAAARQCGVHRLLNRFTLRSSSATIRSCAASP